MFRSATTAILLRLNFVHEMAITGVVQFSSCSKKLMVADIGTKSLKPAAMKALMRLFGLGDHSNVTDGF